MKKTLFFLVSIIVFVSCSSEIPQYQYVPVGKKPVLNDKDTIFYQDAKNHIIDTVSIYIWRYMSQHGKDYSEFYNVKYEFVNQIKSIKYFSTSFGSKEMSLHNDGYYYYLNIVFEATQNNITKYNFEVNGVIYPVIYTLTPNGSMPESFPQIVYYSIEHGIIRYDYADGRKYERITK